MSSLARDLLSQAGITVDGTKPYDVQVHDKRLFSRVLRQGSLGLGESYMDGWWDCQRLDEFFTRILKAKLDQEVKLTPATIALGARAALFNLQSKTRSWIVGEEHYDLGNDLYEAMLDELLTYSCGYWKDAKNLKEAQQHKLEMVCKKIGLKRGQRVLDIGCGWGSFAYWAAKKHKASVVGVTISKEQARYAKKRCKGLPVEIRLQDYRELDEQFDHIISIGMFEHVGHKNYDTFMRIVRRLLKDQGLFLLHTIGNRRSARTGDPWMHKHIFPHGMLPSIKQIAQSCEGRFVIEDVHNFGADYDKTLMAWHGNFERHWPQLTDRYDERFHRMWRYYLLSCAGSFRARKNQLWQLVLSKEGVPEGYERPC